MQNKTNFQMGQNNEVVVQMVAVFDRLFKYFTVLLVLGVAIAAMRIRETGLLISYPVQWFSAFGAVLIVLLRGKIPYQNRLIGFLALGLIYGGIGIFAHGILGQGFLIMLFVCVFATIGGQALHGYITAVISTILTVAAGIAFHQGWLTISVNPASYVVSISPWITASATLLITSIYITIALGGMKKLWLENIRRLGRSEAKYRLIAEHVRDVIWSLDLDTMRLNYASPSVRKLGGYTPEEFIGLPLEKTLSPESLRRLLQVLQEELTQDGKEGVDPERSKILEVQALRKDGTYVWIEATVSFIRDSDGQPVGIVGVSRDISERKQAAEEKKRLETQLLQARKMESIGNLAGGIAHDFNNILFPIMGHSEIAMMDLPPNSPVQQNLHQIFEAGERARKLVKQILTFARIQEEDRIPLKVSSIVKEAIEFLRSTIPSTIDIQYNFKTKQDVVVADLTQVNQIVMNLCTNAAHAMRENGGVLKVTLSDAHIRPSQINQLSGLTPGNYLKLSVSDTGSGISPDIINRIFEPYFTTKGPGEGTGMGLAVIHGIVNNYGGAIDVKSDVAKGTTFHVLLPIIDMAVSPTLDSKIDVPGGKERILCVDDQKAAVDTIQPMLEKLGYQVTARTSSLETLEAFRNNPNRFDLVITDQTMPNMTGKDLAKEIRAIRKDKPVILCTGFSEQIDESKAKEMGISAFVMKPIVMRDIANTIRAVLDNK